jgi:hypothetical protein
VLGLIGITANLCSARSKAAIRSRYGCHKLGAALRLPHQLRQLICAHELR